MYQKQSLLIIKTHGKGIYGFVLLSQTIYQVWATFYLISP